MDFPWLCSSLPEGNHLPGGISSIPSSGLLGLILVVTGLAKSVVRLDVDVEAFPENAEKYCFVEENQRKMFKMVIQWDMNYGIC